MVELQPHHWSSLPADGVRVSLTTHDSQDAQTVVFFLKWHASASTITCAALKIL